MIISFQIKNLRSIEDSGVIDLRKLTVLVGRNSSGKSTILRTLPLLRQSVEQRTKGPILWYGRLVDFGDFKNAARDGDLRRGVTLNFEVRIPAKRRSLLFRPASQEGEWLVPSKQGLSIAVSLIIGRSPDDRVGHVRAIELASGSDDLRIELDDAGAVKRVVAMGEEVLLPGKSEWWVEKANFVPRPVLLEETSFQIDEDEFVVEMEPASRPFSYLIYRCLAQISHGNTSPETLHSIGSKLLFGDPSEFYRQLVSTKGVPSSLQHRVEQIGMDAPEVCALRRAVMLRYMSDILRSVDEEIAAFARSVRYIEPIRASAERYYREQDLAVDDIDSSGANTAVFLSSLDGRALQQLQSWMMENFGFRVEVESGTGHIQIKISDGVTSARNIADLGFGYSQLLPIILQLWRSTRTRPNEPRIALAMEQPELHLHPHYQALLADVMAATAGSTRGSILVETHSDHFLNRLGALVAEGRLQPKDVQVLVVSEDDFGDASARRVDFDKDGTLSGNWPIGFFTPDVLS